MMIETTLEIKKSYGQRTQQGAVYSAPQLFPQSEKYHDYHDLRRYLERELIGLAKAKRLCLTDVINQSDICTRTAAMHILCGVTYSDQALGHLGYPEEHKGVAPALAGYRVRLRSTNGQPIYWKNDMVRESAIDDSFSDEGMTSRSKKVVAEWYHTDLMTIDLDCQSALKALCQAGKHCCFQKSNKRMQETAWRFEEVPPDQIVDEKRKK